MDEGQRIKVSSSCHWARDAIGTISLAPDLLRDGDPTWVNGYSRSVRTATGLQLFYWIRFDTPQLDADGDGPYAEGEIEGRFLEAAWSD